MAEIEHLYQGIRGDPPCSLIRPLPAVEEITSDVHVGEEVGVLEDHADAAFLRGHIDPGGGIEQDFSRQADGSPVRFLQAGHKVHQGRLAAAGWAEDTAASGG